MEESTCRSGQVGKVGRNLQLHDASCAVTDRMRLLPAAHELVHILLEFLCNVRVHLLRLIARLRALHAAAAAHAHTHGVHAVRQHHIVAVVILLLHGDNSLHSKVHFAPGMPLLLPLSVFGGRGLLFSSFAYRHSAGEVSQVAEGAGSRGGADAGVEVGVGGDVGSGGEWIVLSVRSRWSGRRRASGAKVVVPPTGRWSCQLVRERLAIIPRCVQCVGRFQLESA